MDRWLKIIHLLGFALFLGSIPGHIILGVAQPGGDIPPAGIAFSREIVKTATLFVTTPGLALAVVSGLAIAAVRRVNPLRVPWLAAHLILGVAMLTNAIGLIMPAEFVMVEQAHALVNGQGFDENVWHRAKSTEDLAGMVNLAMALVSIGIAVLRPALRRRTTKAFT